MEAAKRYRMLGKYGLTPAGSKRQSSRAFERMRRAYNRKPVVAAEPEPDPWPVLKEEPVAALSEKIRHKTGYRPASDKEARKRIHDERKRIFLDHILFLASRLKA